MKPKLKPLGTERLKLHHDQLLAFKCNLRHYYMNITKAAQPGGTCKAGARGGHSDPRGDIQTSIQTNEGGYFDQRGEYPDRRLDRCWIDDVPKSGRG
jgi:hypothetical protein